jgi:hypothetical protein
VPKLAKDGVRLTWPAAPPNGNSGKRDLAALVEFAASTGARQVHITGGFSDEVVRAFARKKLRVSPLGPPEQRSLFS